MNNHQNGNIFKDNNVFDTVNASLFATKNTSITGPITKIQQKYINDFDSALILENIDKKANNKAVKLNLKINTIERNLVKINEELELIKLLNLEKDAKRRAELINCKNVLENQLEKLRTECRNFGIFYSFIAFLKHKINFRKLKIQFLRLTAEIKKYDKEARNYFKFKNPDLLPFKWL